MKYTVKKESPPLLEFSLSIADSREVWTTCPLLRGGGCEENEGVKGRGSWARPTSALLFASGQIW